MLLTAGTALYSDSHINRINTPRRKNNAEFLMFRRVAQ